MATHDYVINNDTAANVRTDINNALAAIRSSNLSATEPANLYAGLFWFDTTNDELKLRNEANDGWIVMGKFSGNANTSDTPSGAILQFAGSSAPANWLLCDGALISRTTYATLFGVIGTNYGAGDGSTTFKLPDLRGRVPIGAGQGSNLTNRVIAATGGAETHTLTVSQMPSHSHDIPLYDYSDGGQANLTTAGTDDVTDFRSNSQDPVDLTGGGQPHNNMQPFLVVNHIIKV
jgi:microcystin-dependent protein